MQNARSVGRLLAARVALVAAVVAGVTVALGATPGGATIPVSWGTVSYPAGLPDNDCGNEFAVDAAGNIYTLVGGGGDPQVQEYTPSTGATVIDDPSANFGSCSWFTADSAGNVYVWDSSTGNIYELSAGGESLVTGALDEDARGPLATDASGHLFVYDNSTEDVYQIVGSVPHLVNNVGFDDANSIAVGPDGAVYVAVYDSCGGGVDKVTTSSVTAFGTGWCEPESIAVDSLGNVYVANEDSTSLVEVPVGGAEDVMSDVPSVGSEYNADEVFWSGSALFYYEEGDTTQIFTPSAGRPPLLAVVSSIQTSPLGQTDTATWNGVPGAVSYTCTLLYGFNSPTTFTVTTPSRTCSFGGLDPTTEFGIAVVANFYGGSSAPSSAFAAPPPLPPAPATVPKVTIVCENNKNHHLKAVTAVHPRCGTGWHLVG